MKKVFKRFMLILVCALTLCLFGAIACACGGGNGGNGDSDSFTVTVEKPDGSKVGANEVQVQICTTDGANCLLPKWTDASGKVVFSIKSDVKPATGQESITLALHLNHYLAEYESSNATPAYDYGTVEVKGGKSVTVKLVAKAQGE